MEGNAFPAVTVKHIVKWELMSGGMRNAAKTLFGLPVLDVAFARLFVRGAC